MNTFSDGVRIRVAGVIKPTERLSVGVVSWIFLINRKEPSGNVLSGKIEMPSPAATSPLIASKSSPIELTCGTKPTD